MSLWPLSVRVMSRKCRVLDSNVAQLCLASGTGEFCVFVFGDGRGCFILNSFIRANVAYCVHGLLYQHKQLLEQYAVWIPGNN